MNIIEIENSNLRLKNKDLLFEIPEFSISESDVVFLSGVNGVGKSTFFKSLLNFSGVVETRYAYFDGGRVNLGGIYPRPNEKIIYISQDEYLSLPYRKVKDVLKDGFIYTHCNKDMAVQNWLDKYEAFPSKELSSLFNARIQNLSGGQIKYIKIVQALERCDSPDVKLIIFDEPVNHLDAKHIVTLSNLMLRVMNTHPSLSILISSHCHAFPFVNKAYEIDRFRLVPTNYKCFNCLGIADDNGFYKV